MSPWQKMASVLVTASLLFGLVGTAWAQTPEEIQASAVRMQQLGIVNGDPSGDLRLGDPITRAQLMKIMVWAFGQKESAAILRGASAFPDTAGHWASGEIAVAKNIIVEKNHFTMGMPDGTFVPEGKVTGAQAVAFLMKFLGIGPDTRKPWPANYLDAAVAAGMISAGVRTSIAATANAEASRGLVFFLADTAFSSYALPSGKTVYQTYVKPNAPQLTLEAAELTTTAPRVTVYGTVSADAKAVYVHDTLDPVRVTNGRFSFDVDLALGVNHISVRAVDIVSSTTTRTLTVTRTVGAAARIDVPAALTARAGQTLDLVASVKDQSGSVIRDAVLTFEGDGFAYVNGKLTVPTRAGLHVVSFRYGDLKATTTVTVTPVEATRVIVTPPVLNLALGTPQKFVASFTDPYGNPTSGPVVTWSAAGGIVDASGTFVATASGVATVWATAGGLSGSATVSVFSVPVGLKLSSPAAIVGNTYDATTFTVSVVDASGKVVETADHLITVRTSNSSDFRLGEEGAAVVTVRAVRGAATVALKSASNRSSDITTVLTASSPGLTGANSTAKALKQVLTTIKVTADPSAIGADNRSQTSLLFRQYDQQGRRMAGAYDPTIALSLSTSDNTLGTLASTGFTFTSDSQTVLYTSSVKTGLVTIGGAVTTIGRTGIPVESVTVAISPIYYPTQLSMDAIADAKAYLTSSTGYKQAVTVRVKDLNGNQVSNADANNATTLTLRVDSPKTGNLWIFNSDGSSVNSFAADTKSLSSTGVHPVRGQYTFYVGATKAATLAYSVTGIWASSPPIDLGRASGAGSILPGDARNIRLSPNRSSLGGTDLFLPADGVTAGTVTIKVTDLYENSVSGTYTVKVHKNPGNRTATRSFDDLVISTVGGEAAFQVTASTNDSGQDTYTVSDHDSTVALNPDSIVVHSNIIGVPHNLGAIIPDLIAGKTDYAYVAVRDSNNRVVVTDNSTYVHLVIRYGNQYGDAAAEMDAVSENGIATFPINLTSTNAGGAYYAAATASSLSPAVDASVIVSAGPATAVAITQFTPNMSLAADGSSRADLWLRLRDEYGNDVGNGSDTITLRLDSGNYVRFAASGVSFPGRDGLYARVSDTEARITMNDPDVRINDLLVAQPYIGSTVMTATSAANYTPATAVVNVVGTLAPARMAVTVAADVTAGVDQTVYVDLLDAYGNRVTTASGANANIAFRATRPDGSVWGITLTGPVRFYKGRYTVEVPTARAGAYAYSATGTYASTDLGLATAAGTVNPGVAGAVVIDNQPSTLQANGSDTATFTVRVVDNLANRNTVGNYSGLLEFRILTGNDYVTLLNTTSDISGGVGYATVQARHLAGVATLEARVSGVSGPLGDWVSNTVTVTAGEASNISIAVNLPATMPVHGTAGVAFMVRDANGNRIPGVTVTPAITSSTNSGAHFAITPAAAVTDANGIVWFTLYGGRGIAIGDRAAVTGSFTRSGISDTATSSETTVVP